MFLITLFPAGDIHIWDWISTVELHHIPAQDVGANLICIAWNHAVENTFMFAAGSHDGAVKIWTTPMDDLASQDTTQLHVGVTNPTMDSEPPSERPKTPGDIV